MSQGNSPRKRNLAASVFLVVATMLVYAQIGTHDYISYDDSSYVYGNAHVVEGLSIEGLRWALTSTEEANWHPLTWLSHMLDCDLWGVGAPGMHHLTNLIFHIFNSLLMFFVLRRMTGAFWPSLFVAAGFALHPQHVESVAWLAERKDVLSQFFWMLCIGSYVESTRSSGRKWFWWTLSFLAMGLMSKPMLVTAPFLFLLLDIWPLGRLSLSGDFWQSLRPRLVEKIPMFALVGASSVITFLVQRQGGAVQEVPFGHQMATVVTGYARYIGKALYPIDLAILYPNHVGMWKGWQVASAVVLLLVISAGVYRWRSKPYLLVGWGWFLGTLVPVIGFVSIGALSMADRYTYMPLTGLLIMLAWGVADGCQSREVLKKPVAIAAVSILATWALLSFQQAKTWKDSLSVYEHALSVTQDNAIMHLNYGERLLWARRLDESIFHSQEAVRLDPNALGAYINLGNALLEKKNVHAALESYRHAVEVDPEFYTAHVALGNLFRAEGELGKAMGAYQRALVLAPASASVHRNIGITYLMQGEPELGRQELEVALGLNPNLPELQFQIAKLRYKEGDIEGAVFHLENAVVEDPDNAEAYRILGASLLRLDRQDEALESYQRAVDLDPDDFDSLKNLGMGLVILGRPDEAMVWLRRAVERGPDEAVVYYNLASGLRALNQFDQAVENYQKATEIDPTYMVAYLDASRLLREEGRVSEAVEVARRAVGANPESAQAYNSLGVSLATAGEIGQAANSFQRAVELDPEFMEAKVNLQRAGSLATP